MKPVKRKKELLSHERVEILLKSFKGSQYLRNQADELNDPYVLATLGILYEHNAHNGIGYEYLHTLGPNSIKGLLVLYKKDFVKLYDDENKTVKLTLEGFNLAKKLKETLGGSLELLTKELIPEGSRLSIRNINQKIPKTK